MSSVTGSSPHHPTVCTAEGCGAEIWFAVTTAGHKSMPLNAKSDPTGNVAVHQSVSGTWFARTLGRSENPNPYETRFLPHFATCTKPAEFRRQARKAVADLHKTQRNKRGRRPAREAIAVNQPGMFRIDPGATR